MTRLFRREHPPIRVEPGERLLADAVADTAHLGGTRDAFYILRRLGDTRGETFRFEETLRIPWESVQAADWDRETSTLRVSEVGSWGEQRPEHYLLIEEPGRLLELVRERVTASVVYQQSVQVDRRRRLRVIARRAPHGRDPIEWFYEYDEGVDPTDPTVRHAAEQALATARADLGVE